MSRHPLLAHDLIRTFGARRVLDCVSIVAAPGQRVGLIGENGTGKSTLLRLLAGVDEPNHLSSRLCDELEEALGTGPGAVVVASHDRWLRDRWPGRELALSGVTAA